MFICNTFELCSPGRFSSFSGKFACARSVYRFPTIFLSCYPNTNCLEISLLPYFTEMVMLFIIYKLCQTAL
jgi:hypothetical protein